MALGSKWLAPKEGLESDRSRPTGDIWGRLRAPLGGQKLPRGAVAIMKMRSQCGTTRNAQMERG